MKKSDIAQAYEKYLGPKCSRTTYYINIKKGMNFMDAMKPVPKEKIYKPGKIITKKFKEELERYVRQTGEKTTRSRFYQRLYQGWSKEEAIKLTAPIHYKKIIPKAKQPYVRPKTPVIKKADIKDYGEIRVRYTGEEARVFSKEYENMIRELHDKYHTADDMEAKEINDKLDKLVKEYQIFLESQSPVKEADR